MKDIIEELLPKITNLLTEMGKNINKPINCLNPYHDDKHPSMSFYKAGNVLHCFSCKATYNIFSLYALQHNYDVKRDFRTIVQELCDKYCISYEQKDYQNKVYQEAKFEYNEDNLPAIEYLCRRGISLDVITKYNIAYNKEKNAVVFKIDNETDVLRSIDDNAKNKHLKIAGQKNKIFNYQKVQQKGETPIFVTESIIDALSIETVAQKTICLALNGAGNYKQFIDFLVEKEYKGIVFWLLDTDMTGILTSIAGMKDLEARGIYSIRLNQDNGSYTICKDINELLNTNKPKLDDIIKTCRAEYIKIKQRGENKNKEYMEKYSSTQAVNNLIHKIQNKEILPCISTGFITLDNALAGGFSVGTLNVLGGMSGLGKTTLAMQIADNIAKQGNDVLIFSLEMSKEELILKTLSRLSCEVKTGLGNNVFGYSTKEIMYNSFAEQDPDLMDKILDRYNKFSQNIYIFEFGEEKITADFIVKRTIEHIEKTTKKHPLVIIDYLQIIPAEESNAYKTDRSQMDENILKFKKLARDHSLPVLVISALNRASYNQEVTMGSFRDSSCIEYTSDLLIALSNTLTKEQTEQLKNNGYYLNEEVMNSRNERTMTLKILKQRNGCVGDLKNFKFFAKYNTFKETI